MIHIQINSSPDKDVETKFQFFQNEIYIGFASGNLRIKDSLLKPSHIMIEVVEGELIVHPQKDVEFYLIDGKRSSTVRKIKANQKITIGETTLEVLSFEETTILSKKAVLDGKLKQLLEASSGRLSVIEKIAKLMK